jgi:hypothetical protein
VHTEVPCQDTSVSGLWTPSSGDPSGGTGGDNGPGGTPPGGPSPGAEPSAEEIAALRELHERLLATPVVDVIVNHALGIWQLALVHLGMITPPDEHGNPPAVDLASAGVAIDAMAALVDGLGARLGEHEPVLREALANAQQLYVEVADQQGQG